MYSQVHMYEIDDIEGLVEQTVRAANLMVTQKYEKIEKFGRHW